MNNGIITAVGHYEPEKVMTNSDIADLYAQKGFLSEDKQAFESKALRNGFVERRRASDIEDSRTMATQATINLVGKYGIALIENLDAIHVGTLTAGYLFPSISSFVAKDIEDQFGIKFNGYAYDINNACPSGLNAIVSANQAIKAGDIKKALIIGSDKMTSMVDGFGQDSLLLFGDAAGALILESNHSTQKVGVQGTLSRTFPQDFDDVYYKTGLSVKNNSPMNEFIMNGGKVYSHGVTHVTNMIKEYINTNNLQLNDFDYIIPHQANKRMLDQIGNNLDFDNSKILKTVHENGNTAAASPLLTLSKYENILKSGDRILLLSLGAGFSVVLVDCIWNLVVEKK